MALTVRRLAAAPDPRVRMLVAGSGPDRPITWVHVSELDDPTPFLSGGELLLTTGLGFPAHSDARPDAHANARSYVERLSAAGVVGLGFGIGLSHGRVPDELLEAAEGAGLALLEVPRETPFIAISRAVSGALAADEYAAVTRTFTAQQELTKAALAPGGPDRLIRLLARQVDAWVALVDPAGAAIAVHPESARARLPAVAEEVARLRTHRGSVASGFAVDRDTVSLQPVGAGARRRAFLAVGKPGPLSAADRHLVNASVLLLTLGFEQATVRPEQLAALRTGLLQLALAGPAAQAREIAARAGVPLPADPFVVLVGLPAAGVGAARAEIDVGEGAFAAELDGALVVLAPVERADRLSADLSADAAFAVGLSAELTTDELADGHRRALRAADAARRTGRAVLPFAAIGSAGVTGLLDPGQAAAFAESLLAPLLEHDRTGRGDLVASLRSWLAHHGQWDPAAAALGVHRHTLRNRIRTAERLLDRDLGSPTVRSELWLALELLDG